ncbi:MAG: hypothetical protein ACKOA4_00560 [Haliscomenobacter sp.]
MRYALLMVFAMLFAGIQSINAQSCCAKGQAGKTAAASMEKGCTGMAKASAATTPEAGTPATASADNAGATTTAAAPTMACADKMTAVSVANNSKKECCGNCPGNCSGNCNGCSSCDPAHCDKAKSKGKASRKASL